MAEYAQTNAASAQAAYDLEQAWRVAGEIQHGGWLMLTGTAVDDQIDRVTQTLLDLVWIGQRPVVAGQHQGATHDRFAQRRQQGANDGIVWHPDADGLAARML